MGISEDGLQPDFLCLETGYAYFRLAGGGEGILSLLHFPGDDMRGDARNPDYMR